MDSINMKNIIKKQQKEIYELNREINTERFEKIWSNSVILLSLPYLEKQYQHTSSKELKKLIDNIVSEQKDNALNEVLWEDVIDDVKKYDHESNKYRINNCKCILSNYWKLSSEFMNKYLWGEI